MFLTLWDTWNTFSLYIKQVCHVSVPLIFLWSILGKYHKYLAIAYRTELCCFENTLYCVSDAVLALERLFALIIMEEEDDSDNKDDDAKNVDNDKD